MFRITIVISLIVEALLVAIFLTSLKLRSRFVSHYPEFRRFYDYGMLSFGIFALSKAVFLLLDLEDHGVLELPGGQLAMVNTLGNFLMFIGLLMLVLGWVKMFSVLTIKYELVPVVEFGSDAKESILPGLYLCDFRRCGPLFLKLLEGRAGLVVSRSPPSVVKDKFKLEKTPVVWLTKVSGERTISPTHLEALIQLLVDFMKRGGAQKVIYLNGLEYLILENGFVPVFRFLTALKDYAVLYNSIVLVPFDEKILGEKHLNALLREFEKLGGD